MDAAPSSQAPAPPPSPAPFTPVAAGQRIEALDVVRGFALFGIFLMNIEWFNRPIAALNDGMPRGLTGLDWFASWFVAYFVAGKFWTMFALLFGMGFAVMLVRAERAGRAFTKLYLRRILALGVFGALHFIFVWEGDILFSYAVGALALLILLYGTAVPIVTACAVLLGLGLIPDAEPLFAMAGGLATIGLLALYLRGTKELAWRGVSMPVFSFILLVAGAATSIAALVLWALPDGPTAPRVPLSVFGPLLLVTGWLSCRYRVPPDQRGLHMALGIYVFAGVAMTAIGVLGHVTPDPAVAVATASAANSGAENPGKKQQERAEKASAEREKRLQEQAERRAEEIRIFTTGTYLATVDWRARQFVEKAAGDGAFAVALVSTFLIGVWFVRSGVMENTNGHLAFFRKLALYGIPLGVGLGLLGSAIAMSHTPGDRQDGWGIARGLLMLSALPACLGYVGAVVTMLHSRTAARGIRVLAPAGRMALTHYLMQSLICMMVFYGFGFGQWGMPRAQQVAFVVVVYAAQVAFSHWWLARFRYGPMEWLWRGFTYRQLPPLRISGPPVPASTRAL